MDIKSAIRTIILGLACLPTVHAARADERVPTGQVEQLDVAKVDPMPKAGGKWNTYEITAKGSQLTVVLNGQKTVDVQDSKHASGPFALQYGSGVIKFRKVYIKPL